MFTLSLLYVIFYLVTLLALLVFSFSHTPVYALTHMSTTNFIIFIQKYVPTKSLFLFLVFCLTGLPPVGLFFVKFNLLAFILYQTHFFNVVILFLFFFLNMLYYIQLFNFKNFKKPIYNLLNSEVSSIWNYGAFYKSYFTTYRSYKLTLFIVNTLLFLILTVLFFTDYFLLLNL